MNLSWARGPDRNPKEIAKLLRSVSAISNKDQCKFLSYLIEMALEEACSL